MAFPNNTLGPSGGGYDYTILSVWESTVQGEFSASPQPCTLECFNFNGNGNAGSMQYNGWTGLSAVNKPTIYATEAEGPNGSTALLDGFYLTGASSAGTIDYRQSYLTVRNIGVRTTATAAAGVIRDGGNANGILLDSLVIVVDATPTSGAGVHSGYTTGIDVINCKVVGTYNGLFTLGTMRASSNTIIDCLSSGVRIESSNAILKNNIAYNSVADDYSFSGTQNAANTNNASEDLTASGANPQTSITTSDFADYAGGDYSPAASGKLDGTGADLSTDFTADITGATRTVPWTIGAYIVAGGPPPVGIQEMYIKDGGIFVKYTPYVNVGGTFQEVDAYVLEGGAWVPVHEK